MDLNQLMCVYVISCMINYSCVCLWIYACGGYFVCVCVFKIKIKTLVVVAVEVCCYVKSLVGAVALHLMRQ